MFVYQIVIQIKILKYKQLPPYIREIECSKSNIGNESYTLATVCTNSSNNKVTLKSTIKVSISHEIE